MTEYDTEAFDALEEYGYSCEVVEILRHKSGTTIIRPAFNLARCKEVGYSAGTKVVFLNKNGYDMDRKRANDVIGENNPVTVRRCHIDSWNSDYEFEEVEGRFNTVMFEKFND